ncbi:hypothetical protein Anas_09909, partial [Armadillidium nasatum]
TGRDEDDLDCYVCLPYYSGRNATIRGYANNEASTIANDLQVQRSSLRTCQNFMNGDTISKDVGYQRNCGRRDYYECFKKDFYAEERDNSGEYGSWIARGCIPISRKSSFQKYSGLRINYCDEDYCNSSTVNRVEWLDIMLVTSLIFGLKRFI